MSGNVAAITSMFKSKSSPVNILDILMLNIYQSNEATGHHINVSWKDESVKLWARSSASSITILS